MRREIDGGIVCCVGMEMGKIRDNVLEKRECGERDFEKEAAGK